MRASNTYYGLYSQFKVNGWLNLTFALDICTPFLYSFCTTCDTFSVCATHVKQQTTCDEMTTLCMCRLGCVNF